MPTLEEYLVILTQNIDNGIDLADSYYNRGVVNKELNKKELAVQDFTNAIKEKPDFLLAYYNRGCVYQELELFDLALGDYNFLEKETQDANVYTARGSLYHELHNYELALQDFNIAITIDSKFALVYVYRGLLYADLKKYELAIQDYTTAIQQSPDYSIAYFKRGIVYISIKKYELAIQDYTKVIALDSEDDEAYHNRGRAYSELFKYNLALEDYNQSIILNPNNHIVYCSRGTVYTALQKYDLAIVDYNQAIALNAKDHISYFNRGNAYHYKKNYASAIQDYKIVFHLAPEFPLAYLNTALDYYALSEFGKIEFYINLFLYYSYKQKSIALKSGYLFLFKNANYKFILEQFHIEYDYLLNAQQNQQLNVIRPIETYYDYLCASNPDARTKESTYALLQYYLGSPVASYIHFDEVLDIHHLPLTAQELFYYGLMADILQLEATTIINDAIEALSSRITKDNNENYYLGQLYLLQNNIEAAHACFKMSKDFVPSLVMLMSLEEDEDAQQLLLKKLLEADESFVKCLFCGHKKTTIHLTNTFYEQFSTYFYTREVFSAVSKIKERYALPEELLPYKHHELWEVFYFSNKEQEQLDLALRNFEIEQIIKQITNDIDVQVTSIAEVDRTQYLKQIKHSLRENQHQTIREVFDQLIKTDEENGNIENHLGLLIEDFRLANAQLYLYFISYFYLQKKLDSYQALVLFAYLIDIVCKQNSKAIHESIKMLLPSSYTKLFLSSLGLSSHLFHLIHIIKAYNTLSDDFKAYELKKESHYMTFKNNFNLYISLNKETLSEAMFQKKFQCFPAIIHHNLNTI